MKDESVWYLCVFIVVLPPSSFRLPLLDERHLVDLAQRRLSFRHFQQGRLAKEGHALLVRGLLDLRGGTAVEDHGSNTIREVEKFRDRGAAVETGAVAFETARALVEGPAAVHGRVEPGVDEQLLAVRRLAPAVVADLAHEALGEHA